MTAGQTTAIRGIAKRLQGRRASRLEATVAAIGAAVAVFRFLRSGSDDGDESANGDNEPDKR